MSPGRANGGLIVRRSLAGLVIGLVLAAPLLFTPFQLTLLNYIGVYALVALGLVLLTGMGGLTSFGQAAFVGIGAYATAWLTTRYGASPWLGLVAALVITGTVAALLGAVTLRLGGHFLPLSTIAWGIAIFFLFGNIPGSAGMTECRACRPSRLAASPSRPTLRCTIWSGRSSEALPG